MKRIRRFDVLQTAKVAAIIYFFISLIFVVPLALLMGLADLDEISGMPIGGTLFFIMLPFIYAVLAFVMVAVGCLVYNWIAGWAGGIEIEVETMDS